MVSPQTAFSPCEATNLTDVKIADHVDGKHKQADIMFATGCVCACMAYRWRGVARVLYPRVPLLGSYYGRRSLMDRSITHAYAYNGLSINGRSNTFLDGSPLC